MQIYSSIPKTADRSVTGAQHPLGCRQGTAAPLQRKRIGVSTALLALRFYKRYWSIWMGGGCRFEPTCSQFAYEAIERFGVARGSWLALKRLLRCHPLSGSFGYDPVPESRIDEMSHGCAVEVLRPGWKAAGPQDDTILASSREFPQGLKALDGGELMSELKLGGQAKRRIRE
jgi:uncharacterized protein